MKFKKGPKMSTATIRLIDTCDDCVTAKLKKFKTAYKKGGFTVTSIDCGLPLAETHDMKYDQYGKKCKHQAFQERVTTYTKLVFNK